MDTRNGIALVGIGATLIVALANFIYTIVHNRRATFVNTVTNSRLKWIDSLRDKVSAFIATTMAIISCEKPTTEGEIRGMIRERDTLSRQIILHLNPNDVEDKKIRASVESIVIMTNGGLYTMDLQKLLDELLTATQTYLKKEWNRVKSESGRGTQQ